MKRFVEQDERSQIILFPERLDDYVNQENPVRVVDVFVERLHLTVWADLGLNMLVLIRPVSPLHVLKDVRFRHHPESRRIDA